MSNDTAITSLKEKIDDLNQQAWEVRVTDLPKAFELSQESVKLARSINYPRGLAEGLRSLGFSYVRFFKNDEAAPLLKESLSLFQSLNDLKGQAIVYEYLGIIERNWGNLGRSLELLLKGNDLIRQTDPPEIEITSCYQIGVTYKHLGNHESALDYLYRTLSLAKKINFTLMEAYAIHIIGSIYFDNGNYNQALDCYQQGLIIRRQSNDKWGEAGSLDNIGFTYLKLNDVDKAIEYCKQSLAICQATGDKKGEANALLHLGEIYEQAGDIKQAADFSNESLEIRKARGDKRGETEVLLFLADLYKNLNDVEDHQIFEWLSGALKIADEIKAQDLLSKTYYDLHEYYQRKGDFKESLVQLEAHFQIEKELHKNSINQKIANLEISHKAEVVSQRNKELTELNEKIEKANEELKIEASLERVRSRTNAMHRSENLHEVINEVNDQLRQLGFQFDGTDFMTDFSDRGYNIWLASFPTPIYVPAIDHKLVHLLKEVKKRGDNFFTFTLTTEEKNQYFKNVFQNTIAKNFPEELKQYVYNAKGMATSCVVLKNIILSVTNFGAIPYSDRENEILKRFAFVFEQSYTRFLDLQKAEAQAREAQIEAALERVRSRTMAMHKSDELAEVATVLFEQMSLLDNRPDRFNIRIANEAEGLFEFWATDQEGHLVNKFFRAEFDKSPVVLQMYTSWKAKEKILIQDLKGDQLSEWVHYIKDVLGVPFDLKHLKEHRFLSSIFFSHGMIGITTNDPPDPETIQLIERFAKVFEQTYTRFLDLKKAEAQARESQIEAALEKVRSRSLAMHTANELGEVVTVIVEKLKDLGVVLDANGVVLCTYFQNSKNVMHWIVSPDYSMAGHYLLPYFDHPIFNAAWQSKENGDEYFSRAFSVEEKNSFFEHAFEHSDYRHFPDEFKQWIFQNDQHILSFAWQKNSAILIPSHTGVLPSEEDVMILKRFSKVFEQSYVRFLDLQKAEAQARESQIEAALERVRSRTMGMQKSEELKDVIQVVYEQFVHLNIHIEHTGFIMDYKTRDDMHIWLADRNEVPSEVTIPYFDCAHWNSFNESKEKGKSFFANHLSFEEKNKFYQDLFKLIPGMPEETKEYYFSCPGLAISTVLLDNVGLYIENFSGIPYSDEENATLMRFGKVFQQTYTRFNDLKLAEAHAVQAEEDLVKLQTEKKRAEDALSELQVTQKQLIQAEKMASLGELTAGIAHEIQNPLNFVNNFSDVNKELLVEMKEEIENGNTEEVIAIANDIISNEEKINHHGKRADAIVKGMLQHSRSSSGVKEPTDINELADEYLRLAYHGLRAKDKSFNATMKTDFDEAIGKVNVIPQDIGRVFLNLITNAFYVVSEKKRQLANGYEPTVTVTTKKESDKVVVSVKDNGNGIPQKVLDKIFQPFFTTKPTGQGTGLGLSLSYDIVRAHSGEIKVKTKDGEGSEFVIQLPIDQ